VPESGGSLNGFVLRIYSDPISSKGNFVNQKDTEKLSAYLDGELAPDEARAVTQWLESDADARQALDALRSVKEELGSLEPSLPDMDAGWADLQSRRNAPKVSGRLIRFPGSWGAVAALILLGMVLWFTLPVLTPANPVEGPVASSVEMVETDLEDSSLIVYVDDESGWVVVWVEEELGDAEPI